jgi:hypothetical protein
MQLNVAYNYKWMLMQLVFKFGWILVFLSTNTMPKCRNIITYMTIFVVIKGIYNYHDYSAYKFITKAISHFLVIVVNATVINCSHNGMCLLRLFIFLIIILYNYDYLYLLLLFKNWSFKKV